MLTRIVAMMAVTMTLAFPRASDVEALQRSGGASTTPMALTPQDYIDIQQLASRYAWAIDNCTNNGYGYADLFVPNGWFAPSRNGRLIVKYQGRDKLAEAALGGAKDCAGVPWNGIRHLMANHLIEPSPEGAAGKVYLVAIGLDGEPGKVEAQGHYEDVYVKTPLGWRFKSRIHVLSAGQELISQGSRPRQSEPGR